MSLDKKPRTFRVRVQEALRRRIGTGTGRTVKQVAREIGCSETTIENLMGGHNEPSSPILRELMLYFDDSFANEVWGCDGFVIVRLDRSRVEAARRVVEAQEELRRLA